MAAIVNFNSFLFIFLSIGAGFSSFRVVEAHTNIHYTYEELLMGLI